jgi:hypothetical protein
MSVADFIALCVAVPLAIVVLVIPWWISLKSMIDRYRDHRDDQL